MSQKTIIDMAADRAPYVDQTQSMNIFVKSPTFKVLNSMHFYSWRKGLKTGCYYLRSLPKSQAQKFSVDLERNKLPDTTRTIEGSNPANDKTVEGKIKEKEKQNEEPPECLMCSA